MSTELIIILELIAVQVIVLLVSVVVWRDKTKEIHALREVNQALVGQLDQMQSLIDGKNESHEEVAESFKNLDSEFNGQVTETLDDANSSLGKMERLMSEHRTILTGLDDVLNQPDPDLISARSEIEKLKVLLESTDNEIVIHKDQLNKSEMKVNTLKDKMDGLSSQILTMNSLEISEGRLKREKNKLLKRMAELEDKYESEKILAKKLEGELKTSFKAAEVQSMRDDLQNTEEALKRTVVEKEFIEQHFLDLANNDDPEELNRELKRVKREMRQLEKGILDSD
jgi:chromosome segregation ATPase